MDVYSPRTLNEALQLAAEHPEASLLAGGTDLLVEMNFHRARPEAVIYLGFLRELNHWAVDNGQLRFGANLTYTRMQYELEASCRALAQAARTVGSPQIRNAGTIGGNLGTGSPAGDTLPILVALDAEIVLRARDRERRVAAPDYFLGPKRVARQPGELIVEARCPQTSGPSFYLKVGPRNAMCIAVSSLALFLDAERRQVRVGLGSVGPVPLRAPAAESLAAEELAADRYWSAAGPRPPLPEPFVKRFAELCGEAARPIDDVRATAEYRRHTVRVMARRALSWAWEEISQA